MKILAIDPGTVSVGLAASDELQLTTRLLPVLKVSGLESCVRQLVERIIEEGFGKVLVGLPLNMDGSEGPAARRARSLGRALEAALKKENFSCEVLFWDERLTSFEAEQRLREKGISKKKAKGFLDSIAAEVLLQDYLRTHLNNASS